MSCMKKLLGTITKKNGGTVPAFQSFKIDPDSVGRTLAKYCYIESDLPLSEQRLVRRMTDAEIDAWLPSVLVAPNAKPAPWVVFRGRVHPTDSGPPSSLPAEYLFENPIPRIDPQVRIQTAYSCITPVAEALQDLCPPVAINRQCIRSLLWHHDEPRPEPLEATSPYARESSMNGTPWRQETGSSGMVNALAPPVIPWVWGPPNPRRQDYRPPP